MPALIYGIEAWGYIKKGRNDGNRNMASRIKNTICDIDVVSKHKE